MKKTKNNMASSKMQDKAMSFMGEQQKLLKKHKLAMRLVVSFHQHRKVPTLGKLGIWLIRVNGGILDTMFMEDKK